MADPLPSTAYGLRRRGRDSSSEEHTPNFTGTGSSTGRAETDLKARTVVIGGNSFISRYAILELQDPLGERDASISMVQAGDISFPSGGSPAVIARVSRGTILNPSAVAADDGIRQDYSYAYSGTDYQPTALVFTDVKAISGGIVAGRWTLYVHPRNGSVLLGAIQVTADTTKDDSLIINLAPNAGDTLNLHGSPILQMVTGSYTGDGGTSQSISLSPAITPKFVLISRRETVDGTNIATKGVIFSSNVIVDDNASGGAIAAEAAAGFEFRSNAIIAMAAGSFTVDDNGADEDPNANGVVYNYVAWGG